MKIQLSKFVLLATVFICASVLNYAQEGIKFRVAVNSGMFISEPGSDQMIADPIAAGAPNVGSVKFSPKVRLGIEAEVSVPVSPVFGLGIEVKNTKFGGNNDDPAYYNYFASPFSPILSYQQEPLIYNTNMLSFLGNIRINPFGQNSFTPYIKIYGGIAMIGTDLRFKNAEDQVEIMDPLYSRGTRLSITEPVSNIHLLQIFLSQLSWHFHLLIPISLMGFQTLLTMLKTGNPFIRIYQRLELS
jgi:hypothetical protein